MLHEAWQARQVPEPEYMPGIHDLWWGGHGRSQVKVVNLAWGGRHWPPSGYQPSLQELQTPREPLQESQPAGQARHSLKGEELK